MPQSFIHYVPRHVALRFPADAADPWYRRFQRRGEGFDRPSRHTTRQRSGVAPIVVAGDTLWIVSQVHSRWGASPPGIDARLDIEDVKPRRGGGFHYLAAATSTWFAMADATTVLQSLEAHGERRPLWIDPARPIGHSLQSLRHLHDDAALHAWERALDAMPLDFISYRIADGSEPAFRHALDLLGQRRKVFWDRWGLPRRLAERREVVANRKLDAHLMAQLRKADTVWGIETDAYRGAGSYAQKECVEAVRLRTYRPVVPDASPSGTTVPRR